MMRTNKAPTRTQWYGDGQAAGPCSMRRNTTRVSVYGAHAYLPVRYAGRAYLPVRDVGKVVVAVDERRVLAPGGGPFGKLGTGAAQGVFLLD